MNQQAIVDDPSLPSISLVDETLLPSSPFNQPYHSPSPAHSASPDDIPYQTSNDYGYQPSPSPSAHNFGFGGPPPGTPSYQGSPYGSRHNSPLGDANSWAGDGLDLDPLDGTGAQLHMFDNDGPEEYNPSEYDIPASTNPAHLSPYEIMADEFDFSSPPAPGVSIDPADTLSPKNNQQQDTQQQYPQDNSPASSAGLDNPRSPSPSHIMPHQQQRSRSRASSIASSHGSPNSHMGDPHQQNPGFDPQWGSVTAPSPPPNGGSRSPPALLIPDNTQQNHLTPGGLFPPEMVGVPRLGIPGVGDSGGPGINLIPATPVSGGGNGVTAGIPFGGHFGQTGAPDVDTTTSQRPRSPLNSNGGPAGSVTRTATTPPPPRTPPPFPLPSMSVPSSTNNNNNQQPPPGNPVDVHMWIPNPADQQAAGGMNVNMTNPSHGGSAGSNPPSPYMGHRHSPSPVPNNPMLGGGAPTAPGHSLGVPYLKRERSKSDTFSNQQRPAWALGVGTWNTTSPPPPSSSSNPMATMTADAGFMPHPSSADAYHTTFQPSPHHSPQLLPQPSFPPIQQSPYMGSNEVYLSVDPSNMRRARSDVGGHRRGAKSEDFSQSSPGLDLSFSGGLLAPPVSGHPSLMVPGEYRGRSPMGGGIPLGMNGGMGHHRRASSGSRAGSVSGGSSVRASPYPSPNASPMLGYAQLGPDVGTVNMGNLSIGGGAVQQQPVMQVARPHVTTSATQAASQTRRTSEATFTCPVPGCGSTFTRHFNLKGHMRSHNDERPFKCKWPGCEKGFARQHDCKRHEQLHLNIRPYTCEGCSRTFARMDALNRHLRSEGGAECAKHQQPLTEEKVQPKQEDPAWRPGAVLT